MSVQVRITSFSGCFRYNCDGTRNSGSTTPLSLGTYDWGDGVRLMLRPAAGNGGFPTGGYTVNGVTVQYSDSQYLVDHQNGLYSLLIPAECDDIPDGSTLSLTLYFETSSVPYPSGFMLVIDGEEHIFGMPASSVAPSKPTSITFEVPDGKQFDGYSNEQGAQSFATNFSPSATTGIKNSVIEQDGNTVTWTFWYNIGVTAWRRVEAVLVDSGPPAPISKTVSVYLDSATNAYIQNGNNKFTQGKTTPIGTFEAIEDGSDSVVFYAHANDLDIDQQYSINLSTTASAPAVVEEIDDRNAKITIPKSLSSYDGVDAIHISVSASSGWLPVEWELPNASANPKPDWWKRTLGMSTHIVPNGGYVIETCEVRHDNYISMTAEIVFNLDGTVTVTVPAGSGDIDDTLSIKVTTKLVSETDHIIVAALNHCSSNIVSTSVPDGGDIELSYGTRITLVADAGYSWESPPNAQLDYDTMTYYGELVDGDVVFDFPIEGVFSDIRIRATAVLSEAPSESLDLGFINVYHPTKEELIQAANSSWWGQDDVPSYVVSIYKTFIRPVEGDAKVAIKFGPYNTQAYSYPVVDQYAIVDCGVVTIPEKFNSSLDYQPVTTIELWLPFIGMQSIATSDVMGIAVSLKYKMNVLTGDVIAELRNSDNGILLGVWTGTCKEKITAMLNGRWESENLQPGMTAITMSDRTPGFIRRTGIVVDAENSSQLDKTVKKWLNLSDISGWCRFERIIVDNVVATSDEKKEIEQLLKEGVIL